MQDLNIVASAQKHVEEIFNSKKDCKLTYHNYGHTKAVFEACNALAEVAGLNDEEKELLSLAAIFHDVGYNIMPDGHEKISADMAADFLAKYNYDPDKIKKVKNCILATELSWQGDDPLCLLIRDADMNGLANQKYFEIAEQLRLEQNSLQQIDVKSEEWLSTNIDFLKNHKYQTAAGKKLFKKGKKKNLNKLMEYNNKSNKVQTISNSKSAQTQLKTALRNHIDLSAIADNKANIMLSVNALVITVGLPILLEQMTSNNHYLLIIITLGLTSVASMVFATLSTRPAKNVGVSTQSQINEGKSNLFFFGNFYKMNFDEYEKGMQDIVSNDEKLDSAITRDLFYLGKSLGIKFELLRWCYNSFMYGVIIVVLEVIFLACAK